MCPRQPGAHTPIIPNLLDRLAGSLIRGPHLLAQLQNVLRTRGGQQRQQQMAIIRERPPRRTVIERGSRSLGRITRGALSATAHAENMRRDQGGRKRLFSAVEAPTLLTSASTIDEQIAKAEKAGAHTAFVGPRYWRSRALV